MIVRANPWTSALSLLAVALPAAGVLGWNLGERYLWQDEAATAVLAERMLRLGKPLAYDGRNLITMDFFAPAPAGPDSIRHRTGGAEGALRFYVERGDFKADTTWIGQPWGQFVLAGTSLRLLGHGTLQARLPFAIAAVLSVVLLFHLLRSRLSDPLVAALAAGLLLANVFWVLHVRQCRYYALSTLFVVLALLTYLRWREGGRLGASLFVATAFGFFQCDYGTFWPVFIALGTDACVSSARPRRAVATFGALLAAVAPWVWYYELAGRLKETPFAWSERFLGTLFSVNQFELPLVFVPLLVWLLFREHGRVSVERRLVALSLAIVLLLVLWVPVVSPAAFHRYVVAATPLATLLVAFAIVRTAELVVGGRGPASAIVASLAALIVAVSPLPSNAVSLWIPSRYRTVEELGTYLRAEIGHAWPELSGAAPDPNKIVIQALLPLLRPDDEILVSYEDAPFMFYTDARIRGGIPAFRVADHDEPPPRFAVLRRSAPFLHWETIRRELRRYAWRRLPVAAPDIPFGNSPDPAHRYFPLAPGHPNLRVLERMETQETP